MRKFFFSLNWKPLIVVLLLVLPACWPLFQKGFFRTHDVIHLPRMFGLEKNLSQGQFPVRWIPEFRYGEPTFNYYAPLPYYLGAIIHQFGFDFLTTTKIVLLIGFLGSAVAIYFLVKELLNEWAGVLAAVLYTYAPYHSVDVYVRGALSESIALIFFPLIFLFSLRLSKRISWRDLSLLSASLAGLFLTHNVMTLLFTPFILVWFSFLILSNFNRRLIGGLIAAGLLGVGLAAFFLFPAFWERDLVQTDFLTSGYFNFRGHFVALPQFFIPSWGYGASLWGPVDDLSLQLGVVHWLTILISILVLILITKIKRLPLREVSFFGVLFCLFWGSLFIQHNKSAFIWEEIALLRFTQFPWRFLGISIFLASVMGSYLLINPTKKFKILMIVLIAAVIIVNINYFHPQKIESLDQDSDYISKEVLSRDDRLPKDYLPIWVKTISFDRGDLPKSDNEISFYDISKEGVSYNFSADLNKDSIIELPITYFPDWQVKANGQKLNLLEPSNLGLIQFSLSPGHYQIEAKLYDTPVRLIGNLLTLFSLSLVVMITLWRRLKLF